jgi:hypothetical protein
MKVYSQIILKTCKACGNRSIAGDSCAQFNIIMTKSDNDRKLLPRFKIPDWCPLPNFYSPKEFKKLRNYK